MHTSKAGEKCPETRGLTSDIPTYNTEHFYIATSLRALSYVGTLSLAQLNVKLCVQNVA